MAKLSLEESIANMKDQTFGCEIEMAEITRDNAARVVAKFFGTEDTVRYLSGAYRSYECKDRDGRSWKFSRDSSIHATYDEMKCEMVTPVLKYKDIENLQQIVRLLRKAGAKSSVKYGCGVHIHVGEGNHTPQTIRNLINMFACHEDQFIKAIGISYSRISFCKKVDETFLRKLNAKKPTTWKDLAYCWYNGSYFATEHYHRSRYHMVNLHALFNRYHTIEFRMFNFDDAGEGRKGGLHAGQLKAMIQFCLAVSNLAKELKTCSPKKQKEDDSDAFRAWLVRLHLVGDEFATCRAYFTRKMMPTHAYRAINPDRHTTGAIALEVAEYRATTAA